MNSSERFSLQDISIRAHFRKMYSISVLFSAVDIRVIAARFYQQKTTPISDQNTHFESRSRSLFFTITNFVGVAFLRNKWQRVYNIGAINAH